MLRVLAKLLTLMWILAELGVLVLLRLVILLRVLNWHFAGVVCKIGTQPEDMSLSWVFSAMCPV